MYIWTISHNFKPLCFLCRIPTCRSGSTTTWRVRQWRCIQSICPRPSTAWPSPRLQSMQNFVLSNGIVTYCPVTSWCYGPVLCSLWRRHGTLFRICQVSWYVSLTQIVQPITRAHICLTHWLPTSYTDTCNVQIIPIARQVISPSSISLSDFVAAGCISVSQTYIVYLWVLCRSIKSPLFYMAYNFIF